MYDGEGRRSEEIGVKSWGLGDRSEERREERGRASTPAGESKPMELD